MQVSPVLRGRDAERAVLYRLEEVQTLIEQALVRKAKFVVLHASTFQRHSPDSALRTCVATNSRAFCLNSAVSTWWFILEMSRRFHTADSVACRRSGYTPRRKRESAEVADVPAVAQRMC